MLGNAKRIELHRYWARRVANAGCGETSMNRDKANADNARRQMNGCPDLNTWKT
jgi:hypothetical protein